MSLTLSGTDGVVGAGFTLDSSGASVTAGVGTFGTLNVDDKIIHTGDTDTAIRFPGSDQISFETGGTQRMIIGSGGAIAITDTIQHTGDVNTKIRFPENDTITAETGGVERLRIKSDGKIGIGTTTPTTALDVNGVISTGSVLSSGIVEVSNKPAVSAYLNTTTNHSGAPSTVPFDAETFDHGGCFNATSSAATLNGISVPAHAFLPNVAGIYHVSVTATSGSTTSGTITDFHVALRKNSTDIGSFDADPKDTAPENIASGHVSMLVEMNGTSDFLIVKVGATASSGTSRHLAGTGRCTFNAHKLII